MVRRKLLPNPSSTVVAPSCHLGERPGVFLLGGDAPPGGRYQLLDGGFPQQGSSGGGGPPGSPQQGSSGGDGDMSDCQVANLLQAASAPGAKRRSILMLGDSVDW